MQIDLKNIHPGFSNLFVGKFSFSQSELELFLSHFVIKKIKKKDYYLRAGEFCNAKAFVNKGCARNFVVDEKGHERILFFAFEDWWLGDFESFYENKPGTNYVQTLEDCELLEISKKDFFQMEEKIPKLKQWYTVKLTRAATASIKRIEEIKTLSPEERYIALIEKQPHIFQRVPLQHIASFLNIEAPSLSRMRKRLAGKK